MEIDLDHFDDDSLVPVNDFPHWFELDLHTLVEVNHRLTLEGIGRMHEDGVATVVNTLGDEEPEVVQSAISWEERFYDQLRRAANNLAVVGLVTRLQYWIEVLVKQHKIEVGKPRASRLVTQLLALKDKLGEPPVPVDFFDGLVNARDSVIHADARAEWLYRSEKRQIPECYRNPYDELEISEGQLQEAIAKAIEQVKWYDEKLGSRA